VALFGAIACCSLLLGFVNVRAVAELGRPLNYQWLYYSHFMQSMDSYTALAALLSWRWVGQVLAGCLVLLLSAELLARGSARWLTPVGRARVGAALAGGVGAYLALAWPAHVRAGGMHATRFENPVVALVGSVLTADAKPVLAKMPTGVGSDDFLTAGERKARAPRTAFTGAARAAGVRNVLLIVLESVGAQYVSGFGAPDGATPSLDRYRPFSRRFTAAYAHQPSTTHSLVGLLLSVYPPNTFRTVTREHPDIALPSWSGELKRAGYRTAFINAGDNQFQREDAFLAHRRFDEVVDASTDPCTAEELQRVGADECTMRRVAAWVERDPGRPFFAVTWSIQTHFPYTVSRLAPAPVAAALPATFRGRPASDSLPVRFARYRQALQETDRAIGRLLDGLDRRGVLDSTLVAVVGDHGEAFGQHGNMVHRYLYEEEVRVPLVLINRRLFHGEADGIPAGMIDLAPTIMDLLGDSIPAEWQGRTLFTPERAGRVYLFGPYSGLFGYRDDHRKLIYDAIGDETELYDLATDPGETSNLARQQPAAAQEGRERLAAWEQYQNRFYRQVLDGADARP
jgi:arylsulfatase A-like enzyme